MYKRRMIVFISVCLAVGAAVILLRPAPVVPQAAGGMTAEEFWGAKTHLGEGGYDMVVVGDSRALMGVSPAAMRADLPGVDILNFGYLGAGLTADFVEAAVRKVDPSSDEPTLVVSMTPRSLTPSAFPNKHFKQELARPPITGPAPAFAEKFQEAFKPFKPFAREEPAQGPYAPYAQPVESTYREAGWLASSGPPTNPRIALRSYTRHFAAGTFDEPNFEKLLEIFSRTHDDGIKVLAFRPPSTKEMVALENRLSGFREGQVRKRLAEVGVTWLTIPPKPGRKREYASYDGSHLTPKSAQIFSALLAKQIAAQK